MGSPKSLDYGQPVGNEETSDLNLKQVAAELGVHYMTPYRYIRTGRLTARRVGTGWIVSPTSLNELSTGALRLLPDTGTAAAEANWRERLRSTLVMGDEIAAWRIIEQALAAGHGPTACYLDLIVGAINDIGGRSALPQDDRLPEVVEEVQQGLLLPGQTLRSASIRRGLNRSGGFKQGALLMREGQALQAVSLPQEDMSNMHSARIASICSPERAAMTLSHRC